VQKKEIDNLNSEIENTKKKNEVLSANLKEVMLESKNQMKYMEDLQNKIMEVMKKIALKKNITL
jgi:predicted  nucleic acid-binding Zn-ribbon protein